MLESQHGDSKSVLVQNFCWLKLPPVAPRYVKDMEVMCLGRISYIEWRLQYARLDSIERDLLKTISCEPRKIMNVFLNES